MYAMQYTFPLPEDYDMGIIRAHVAERNRLFDKYEGLYEKAFLITEKGKAGASENSYAPFYIWNYAEVMSKFLVGEDFKVVTKAFDRPAVKSWLPLYFSTGKAQLAKPTFATKEIIKITPNTDLEKVRALEYKLQRQWVEHPDNQSGLIGLNPESWELVRFALWTKPQERLADGMQTFEVLHLSAPSLDPAYVVSGC
jgi:hypothetical protein